MSQIIILPLQIINEYGSVKYPIHLVLYEISKKLTIPEQDLYELITDSIHVTRIIYNPNPTLIIEFDMEKEGKMVKGVNLKRRFKIGTSGFSVNLARELNEPNWKLHSIGPLKAIMMVPAIGKDHSSMYPEL